MFGAVPSIVMLVLIAAAAHVYWASGGRRGVRAAIPELNGRPVLHPTAVSTFAVALGLLGAAGLIALHADLVVLPALAGVARVSMWALVALFAVRAIGDFRYVGFFKRIKGTPFARLDTWVYSPLCGVLAALIADTARTH